MSVEAARARLEVLAECHEDRIPLDIAAALIAAEEQPGVDPDEVVAALDRLGAGLRLRYGAPLSEDLARLNLYLFEELGFTGDSASYDDPVNSFMDQVLARKRGLPITLGVLMIEVARRAGLDLSGVGFPGHFLVRPRHADPMFWVDPFNGGRVLTADRLRGRLDKMDLKGEDAMRRHCRPVSPRYVMVRWNNNLKGSWLRRGNVHGAIRASERMLILAPNLLDERKERSKSRLFAETECWKV